MNKPLKWCIHCTQRGHSSHECKAPREPYRWPFALQSENKTHTQKNKERKP